jgi:prolyl-tRNA synthetase
MGALVMAHSDDNGLVLPPKLAPYQVVIVPIYNNMDQLDQISIKANEIMDLLRKNDISVKYDNRDAYRPGHKFAEYELKGVPVRIAIGPRDLEQGNVEIARRDNLTKQIYSQDNIVQTIKALLADIQENIYKKALKFREENTFTIDNYAEFKDIIENKGGFILAHWDGTPETEEAIKNETKATIRCIPFDSPLEEGKCIYSGKPSRQRVLFAKAY